MQHLHACTCTIAMTALSCCINHKNAHCTKLHVRNQIVQWNLWIMDTTGPRWSVCNREVSFTQRVHLVMWWPIPVAICCTLEMLVLLECREALKRYRMDRKSQPLQEQQTFFKSFITAIRACPLSERNLYFVRWGVTSVSVIRSREVSTIWWLQFTINYSK